MLTRCLWLRKNISDVGADIKRSEKNGGNYKQFFAKIVWSIKITPHFYSRFHYVTTRSSFCLKTIEKMSDFVIQRKNVFFEIWRNGGKVFFSSLNIGNINFYKTNTVEMKKKCPDDDKRKFWCDHSFQSAATAFYLKIAKSVIVVSMTLWYHGNEWDGLTVLFQFSSKNILYFQYFKVSIKYYCRINYSYLPLSVIKMP